VNHLREIAITEVDAAMRQRIQHVAREHGCNFTILEGLVTGNILIVMHHAPRPSTTVIEQHEREEFAALPISQEYNQ
jgi:hypothetical protein